MDYEAQLRFKHQNVAAALQRLAKIDISALWNRFWVQHQIDITGIN